jgi:hypothetical protein
MDANGKGSTTQSHNQSRVVQLWQVIAEMAAVN